jgi:phosphodiesterase/alkaline phosphatase D-like protein
LPATIAALANQGDIVVNAASTRAYAGNTGGTVSQYAIAADGTLSALSPATVASGGNQSTGLGLSPDGTHLYVANRGANSVSWMAVGSGDGTLSLAGTIAAAAQPNDVTLSPDGHSAYAANQNGAANSISQYTVAADGSLTSKLPALIATPTTPKTVVFSSDGTNAYVPHQNSPDVGMFTVAGDGTLTAKSPATVASALGAFAAVYSDGPPVTTGPPSATTGAASAITDTGATVAGTVNAHGVATNYTFEYGTSTSFGAISPVSSAGSASTDVAQTADLTGLSPNTTYYYRLVASSSAGDSVGAVHTFRTTGVAVAPVVVTQAVSAVTTTSATVHGQVNPSGQQTVFTFEYGTTTSFGAITAVVALDDADAPEPVAATLTGLAPDTTYYYRVVAANATGTTSGAVLRFSTGPGGLPAVTTGDATGVSASGATLAGTVDAHGAQTAFAFEYGTTNAFGSLSAVDNAGDGNAVQQVTLPISGLQPGTTYLYRLIATNANGTTFGDVHTLTTPG